MAGHRPTRRIRSTSTAAGAKQATAGPRAAAGRTAQLRPPDRPRYYTPPEAAEVLGVCAATVIKLIRNGTLHELALVGPHRTRHLIPREEVDEYSRRHGSEHTAADTPGTEPPAPVHSRSALLAPAGAIAARFLLDSPLASADLRQRVGEPNRPIDVTGLLSPRRGPLERMLLQVARAFQDPANGAISFGEVLRAFDSAALARLALALACMAVLSELEDTEARGGTDRRADLLSGPTGTGPTAAPGGRSRSGAVQSSRRRREG